MKESFNVRDHYKGYLYCPVGGFYLGFFGLLSPYEPPSLIRQSRFPEKKECDGRLNQVHIQV
jgi:hypothetical protein